MGEIESDPQGARVGVACTALPYHCGTAGISAAGECFYTKGMLQVIHTIT